MKPRGKHHMRARDGFTLIEVLATIALMGIILYPVMQAITLATAAAGEAKHKVEAATLAQTKLAELITEYQTLNQTGSGSGDFPDYPGYSWASQIEQRDTNLSQISVRVSWTARNRQEFIDVASMVYSPDSSTGRRP